jgi:hypothetical protein
MNTTSKWILGIIGGLLLAAALLLGGVNIGQALAVQQGNTVNGSGTTGVMARYSRQNGANTPYGYGMMRGGMMNGSGSSNSGSAFGMMGGSGMMGSGMMGGSPTGSSSNVEPLSVDEAQTAIEGYLTSLGNDGLELKEVIIFDNQAYGLIVEKSTGIGAMEVLVDPASKAVYPEHGPSMMWNLKYSQMAYGMMSGWQNNPDASANMPLTEKQAVEMAQKYLDANLPGTKAEDHADVFYGYYTLELLRDSKIAGMLSVNGYSGQVFLHTWHGKFIEISEADKQ